MLKRIPRHESLSNAICTYVYDNLHHRIPVQDIEVNDGSAEKPYFMNKDLMGIIGEKNEEAVEEAKKE